MGDHLGSPGAVAFLFLCFGEHAHTVVSLLAMHVGQYEGFSGRHLEGKTMCVLSLQLLPLSIVVYAMVCVCSVFVKVTTQMEGMITETNDSALYKCTCGTWMDCSCPSHCVSCQLTEVKVTCYSK